MRTTIEPTEPAIECKHLTMPRPRKARMHFVACEECGWVMDGYTGKWERTRLHVSLPVTEQKVFDGMLMCAFTTPPIGDRQLDNHLKHEKRLANLEAKKAHG